MIRWHDVPHRILEIRDRYEELNRRAVDSRTVAGLRERGEYDPDRHGVLDAEPLTAEEWAELLAYGRAIARQYDHPGNLGRAVRAGMSWQQVAEALGPASEGGADAARAAYRQWATGQRSLNASEPGGTLGMTAEQYAGALALTDAPGDPAEEPGAAEDARAAAIRELEVARADRQAADARTWTGVLAARKAEVPVRRVAELAGISPDTVQRWTQAAARGETGPSRARAPQALPGVDLDDADTAHVLDSALREYAALMEHQADNSNREALAALQHDPDAPAAAAHDADAAMRRRWAEIAMTIAETLGQ